MARACVSGGDDRTLRVWDAPGRSRSSVHSGGSEGMDAAFSPDGSRVAIACPSTLAVYDPDAGERVARHGCGANMRELSFTDDGRRIVLGDPARTGTHARARRPEPAPARPRTPEELDELRDTTEGRTPA